MTNLINRHISGVIIVYTSISLQATFWLYQFTHTNNLGLQLFLLVTFPMYFVISSFFVFYTVKFVYNICVPPRWIEQNSQFLSFTPQIHLKYQDINFEDEKIADEFLIDELLADELLADELLSDELLAYESIVSKRLLVDERILVDENGSIRLDSGFMTYFSSENTSSSDSFFTYDSHQTNKTFLTEKHYLDDKPVILTIQIPVYTEDFDETLFHTFENVKKFIDYYNNQSLNWKANVLIHEDGLQKVDDDEKKKRIDYYNSFFDCFYIARPLNDRNGKFKKASNMNFGLRQILKINKDDKHFDKNEEWKIQSEKLHFWYKKSNASSFQIGKYILLVDSDSKFNIYAIPLLIHEMETSPNIGYIQVRTNSIKVVKNTWENAISHFTNTIYDINFLYACSNGFPAPLVGHNAVLRWSALLAVESFLNGHRNDEDAWCLWDEIRVSEDFVMSIYLQHLGYYGKYVFYDCGFKEGVSLNIIDEITKLKKYIYGINEIMFYPCNKWLTDGIMSHLYINFLLSNNINFSTKYALLAYMGSYYSLALSPFVTIWYYFIKFLNVNNSQLYITGSLDTIYSCAFIFFGMSVLTNILIKIKHKFIKRTTPELVYKEICYGLYLTFFYSCVSLHLLSMMLVYFCGLPAKWETTKKEAERLPIRTLIWMYKYLYITGTGFLILIVYGLGFDERYSNTDPKSVVPLLVLILSHMLFPIYTIL